MNRLSLIKPRINTSRPKTLDLDFEANRNLKRTEF